ncbi:hypothetical protein BGZ94_009282 [Podila epigama]|nr:hypothetical protein BGZ94_009282 [Podila epigama]
MRLQVSSIVGPILLLTLATHTAYAEDISTTTSTDAVVNIQPNTIADKASSGIEQAQLLDQGNNNNNAVAAVVGEESKDATNQTDKAQEQSENDSDGGDDEYDEDEDDDEEDYDDDDENDDEEDYDDDENDDDEDYDDMEDYDDEDEDPYAEDNKPYADDEDIELNGIDLEKEINDAAAEAEAAASVESNAQVVAPAVEDPIAAPSSPASPADAASVPEAATTINTDTNPNLRKRDDAKATNQAGAITDEAELSAQATAEPGGACVDSFVNFALRFQDKCSVFCLKTYTHLISSPGGIFECIGCANMVAQGFVALGKDCFGVFTSPPMTAEELKKAREEAKTKAASVDGADAVATEGTGAADAVDTANTPRPVFSAENVMSSLQNVDMGQVMEWVEMGKNVVSVINASASQPAAAATDADAANAASAPAIPQGETLQLEQQPEGHGQVKVQQDKDGKVKVDRKTFNDFVIQAASWVNYKLTPEDIDKSGAYERVHETGVF